MISEVAHYGSAGRLNLAGDAQLRAHDARVQELLPDAAGRSVRLPGATALEPGGPLFVLVNDTDHDVDLRDCGGNLLATIVRRRVAHCWLAGNVDTNGDWRIQQRGVGGVLSPELIPSLDRGGVLAGWWDHVSPSGTLIEEDEGLTVEALDAELPGLPQLTSPGSEYTFRPLSTAQGLHFGWGWHSKMLSSSVLSGAIATSGVCVAMRVYMLSQSNQQLLDSDNSIALRYSNTNMRWELTGAGMGTVCLPASSCLGAQRIICWRDDAGRLSLQVNGRFASGVFTGANWTGDLAIKIGNMVNTVYGPWVTGWELEAYVQDVVCWWGDCFSNQTIAEIDRWLRSRP